MGLKAYDLCRRKEVEASGCNAQNNTYTIKDSNEYQDVDCDQILWPALLPDNFKFVNATKDDFKFNNTVYYLHNDTYYEVFIREYGVSLYHYKKCDDTNAKYEAFLNFIRQIRDNELLCVYTAQRVNVKKQKTITLFESPNE